MLRGMEARGVELAFDLSEFNTEGLGDVAYTSKRMQGGTAYLESFILLWRGGFLCIGIILIGFAIDDGPTPTEVGYFALLIIMSWVLRPLFRRP